MSFETSWTGSAQESLCGGAEAVISLSEPWRLCY